MSVIFNVTRKKRRRIVLPSVGSGSRLPACPRGCTELSPVSASLVLLFLLHHHFSTPFKLSTFGKGIVK